MEETQNTEEKILAAAEEVFMKARYDGARMQEIANKAEINKAMLHYYFRSKDKLFEKIFDGKVKHFFPEISEELEKGQTFIRKVDFMIDAYISLIIRFPYIPLFVLNTVNKDNGASFITKLPISLIKKISGEYMAALEKGEVRKVDPFQLVISILSMCAFPFVARPIIMQAGNLTKADFNQLMEERKAELKRYLRYILVEGESRI